MSEIRQRAAAFAELDQDRPGGRFLRLAVEHADLCSKAKERGDIDGAIACALGALQAAWTAEMIEAKVRWFAEAVQPKIDLADKFTEGRQEGSIGKVRKFVRAYMQKRPGASAAEVWDAMKAKSPRGVEVHDTSNPELRHITTSGQPQTSYRQFANLVSLERPK